MTASDPAALRALADRVEAAKMRIAPAPTDGGVALWHEDRSAIEAAAAILRAKAAEREGEA